MVEALALIEEQPLVAENFKYEWYPGEELMVKAVAVEEEAPPSKKYGTRGDGAR